MSSSSRHGAKLRRPVGRFFESLEGRQMLSNSGFIQGTVFNSTGNTPLPNVTMVLHQGTTVGGAVVQSTTTDGNGYYQFTGLTPGSYTVVETTPFGFQSGSVQDLSQLFSTSNVTSNSITVTIGDGAPPALPWLLTPTGTNDEIVTVTATNPHVAIPTSKLAIGQFFVSINEQDVPYTTPTFSSYCADLNRDIEAPPYGADTNLPYDLQPLAAAIATSAGTSAANAGRIAYLYNHFGLATLPTAQSVGLQLAIWELEYDSAPSDVTTGTFSVDPSTDPAAITAANAFVALSAGHNEIAGYLNGLPVANPNRSDGSQGLMATEELNFYNTPKTISLGKGQTATIGFWHNKNGQALINSLNGGSSSTLLATWLATNFPNLYGPGTGANNLTGKTNADVAAYFLSIFGVSGQKTYAQVLAAALATYATNSTLAGGTMAAGYGFKVSTTGTGSSMFNVGSNGTAIGLMNNTSYTVLFLLQTVNSLASGGVINASAINAINSIFDGINQGGDIS
jgi:hypothetical protein